MVLPLKQRFPSRFDGLALVVGAGAPDLLFGAGLPWLLAHRPRALPLVVAVTVAYCVVLRRFGLPGLFRLGPTIGGVDLRVYGAMAMSRPPLARTAVSALIGGGSHQLLDALSHAGHPVARRLGFDRVLFEVGVAGPVEISISKLIQYTGHTVGSLVTLLLLYLMAKRRTPRVLDWAAADELIAEARPNPGPAVVVGLAVFLVGMASWAQLGGRAPFVIILGWSVVFVVMGAVTEHRFQRRKVGPL